MLVIKTKIRLITVAYHSAYFIILTDIVKHVLKGGNTLIILLNLSYFTFFDYILQVEY